MFQLNNNSKGSIVTIIQLSPKETRHHGSRHMKADFNDYTSSNSENDRRQSIYIPVEYRLVQPVVNFSPQTVPGLLCQCIPTHCSKIQIKHQYQSMFTVQIKQLNHKQCLTRVLNSGRLGVKTPKNFSPDAQILRRGRHDVQIKRPLIMSICL